MNNFFLGVGLNSFQDKNIPKLEYSQSDCYRVKRTLDIFVDTKDSKLYINQKATKKNIVDNLNQLPSNIEYLFVFISSHGKRINKTSYIFCYDTRLDMLPSSALDVSELIQVLSKSRIKNIYLIIDCCEMQFPRAKLNNQISVITPKQNLSYEDTFHKQSLFAKAIIKYIKKHYSKQFTNFASNKYNKLRKQIFSKSLTTSFIYIYGDSGVGKSHFLRQVEENEEFTFYVSIPKLDNLTYDIVLTLISEKIISNYDEDLMNSKDTNPGRFIRFYCNNNPHCQLLIDHFDHLNEQQASRLIQFLKEIPATKLIASSRILNKENSINYFKFPQLTSKDIAELAKEFPNLINKLNPQKLYSHKNYIDLLSFIYEHNTQQQSDGLLLTKEFKNAYKAIAISGGFINLDKFSVIFNLPTYIFNNLISLGILIQHESFFYPHDKIYEVEISEPEFKSYQENAKTYWKCEIESNTKNTKALHSYILLIKTFDLKFNSKECSFYKKLILTLKGRQNTYYLLIVYKYLSRHSISDSLKVVLCEALIDIGKFDEAFYLISTSHQPSLTILELETELLWWKGQFTQCINISSALIKKNNIPNTNLLCSRGIGYFFLGKWDKSQKDLITVIQKAPLYDLKQRYISYCVLATIQGIRGTDFLNCSKNFIEAIKIAKKSGKLSWISLIYGNMGEILWKGSLYKEATDVLGMAKHLAYLTDNKTLLLEINRNLLHTYHRAGNLSDLEKLIPELELIFKDSSDNYVKMQIINSLITHYIFIKNHEYLSLVDSAINLTQNNNEYYIYSLSNLSLITLITSTSPTLAIGSMNKALDLCYKGKNWLAIKQCLDDWDQCIDIYKLNHSLSKQVFQKWHLMLEKELTPYLHHLFDLHAYLLQH
ncbi:caspase family protein [Legionella yabuuchiae]|uniref:caspase family protein n=1 Tax=Legionella yabuuchiae TaxID=376727 RepID=UPI0010548B3E|nr:caspase family protein [Legionella yabuuchiae]